MWRAYQDQGVVVFGVFSMESREQVQAWTEGFGVSFPVLLDTDGRVKAAYEQQMPFPTGAYPQDWVVGTDGLVVYQNNRWDLQAIEEAIQAELRGG